MRVQGTYTPTILHANSLPVVQKSVSVEHRSRTIPDADPQEHLRAVQSLQAFVVNVSIDQAQLYPHISQNNPVWEMRDIEQTLRASTNAEQTTFLKKIDLYIDQAKQLITPEMPPQQVLTIIYYLVITGGNAQAIADSLANIKEIYQFAQDPTSRTAKLIANSGLKIEDFVEVYFKKSLQALTIEMEYTPTSELFKTITNKIYDCDTLSMLLGIICFDLGLPVSIVTGDSMQLEADSGHAFLRWHGDHDQYFNFETTSGMIEDDASAYAQYTLSEITQPTTHLFESLLVSYINAATVIPMDEYLAHKDSADVTRQTITFLQNAYALYPQHPGIVDSLATYYFSKFEYQEALQYINNALIQGNSSVQIKYWQQLLLLWLPAAEIQADTISYFRSLLELIRSRAASDNVNTLIHNVSTGLLNKEAYQEAIPWYQLSIDKDINTELSLKSLALCYYNVKKIDQAKAILAKGLLLFPNSTGLLSVLVDIAADENDYETIINNNVKILAIDPNNQEAKYSLGICYAKTERYDKALAVLAPLAALQPENQSLQSLLMNLRIVMGQTANQ